MPVILDTPDILTQCVAVVMAGAALGLVAAALGLLVSSYQDFPIFAAATLGLLFSPVGTTAIIILVWSVGIRLFGPVHEED